MSRPPPKLRRSRALTNKATGRRGEDLAGRHLIFKGYEIVERNFRTRHGELDIIARDGDTLVVVEVKLRRGTGYGDPLEAVTPRKQHAIRLMTERYLAERQPHFEALRFDVVGILQIGQNLTIAHIEDAF